MGCTSTLSRLTMAAPNGTPAAILKVLLVALLAVKTRITYTTSKANIFRHAFHPDPIAAQPSTAINNRAFNR